MNIADHLRNSLLTCCGFHSGQTVLAACSGGADSVALVHALRECEIPFSVAHVNYNLRGVESGGDEKFVSDLCTTLNVPLYIRQTSQAELDSISSNLQNAARKIRYDFFHTIIETEQINFIATAHHSDDQLETVLMNFLRGSGINGMSGMKFHEGKLIRPFLNVSGTELRNYLTQKNISWREDSSNSSDAYLRNRIRHHLIPALNECDERNGEGWKKSLVNLADESALLNALADSFAEQIATPHKDGIHFRKSSLRHSPEPRLLFNHLLREEGFDFYFDEATFDALFELQPGKKFLSNGMSLHVDREDFILKQENSDEFISFRLQPDSVTQNGWSCRIISEADPREFRGYDALLSIDPVAGELEVRQWETGDAFVPFGFSGTKKISDVLNEIQVPSHLKRKYPVVVFNNEIVWVPGYRIADKYKVTPSSTTVIHLSWKN